MAEEYIVRAGLDSRGFTSGAADIERAIGRVSSASNLLRNGLAALGVALSVQKIIQVNTEFERLGAQLETVTGSVGAASLAFEKLENFAATTPFQLNEVVEAFTQLKARGLDPSIASLTAWGDLGSSMGRSVGDAIRAVGTATVGEYESLKSFGIQASQAGDKVAFTFKGTTELVEKNAQSIEGYLKRLAQNNFAGSMERQSRTLGGAFSNLEDAVAGAIRKFGEGGFNDALRNAIKLMTTAVSSTGDLSASMGGLFGSAIQQAADLADKLGQVLRFLTAISGESEKVKRGRANELIPSVGDAIGSLWGIYSRFVGKPFAQGLDSAAKPTAFRALAARAILLRTRGARTRRTASLRLATPSRQRRAILRPRSFRRCAASLSGRRRSLRLSAPSRSCSSSWAMRRPASTRQTSSILRAPESCRRRAARSRSTARRSTTRSRPARATR